MPKISAPSIAEHREARRDALLAAAAQLMLSGTPFTVAQVASEVGLSRSAVYEYYASAADLIADVLVDEMALWVDEMSPMVEAETDPLARIETWVRGELVGGLYCVALGRAVFGESMFTRIPDASKIALAALVAFCKQHDVAMVDCQQNTSHLASLGAAEISRDDFIEHITAAQAQHIDHWRFDPLYWNTLLPS